MKILIVHPDGTADLVDRERQVEVWQGIVGGWVERQHTGKDWAALCDEDGRLKQYKVNQAATVLARALGWLGDFLVGDIVFVGQNPQTFLDVPDHVVALARRIDIEIKEEPA